MTIRNYIKYPRVASPASWSIPDLCAAYNLPQLISKINTKPIGIISFGGAYSASDMEVFCQKYTIPIPNVTQVGIPFPPNPGGADVENMLDCETITAVYTWMTSKAPNIRFYWSHDFLSTIEQAAADGCSMLSCSWGESEGNTGKDSAQAINAACSAAIAKGMFMTAASGDNDASDANPGPANVDSPGSCPSVICCGGTSKSHGGPEVVWGYPGNTLGNPDGNGSGGGYSTIFPFKQVNQPFVPAQTAAYISAGYGSGRLVPDVASVADPNTGAEIVTGGQWIVVGGTSFAAPFYSGMFGAIDCPRQGMKMKLAKNYKAVFNDIISGNNGLYTAAVGPDAVSGYGSPNGQAIYNLLTSQS